MEKLELKKETRGRLSLLKGLDLKKERGAGYIC